MPFDVCISYSSRDREALYRQTRTNIEIATQLFQQAIRLDGRYAQAYAGLAEAHATRCFYFQRDEALLDKAIESSLKALMYDESIAEAYAALGIAYLVRGDLEASRKAIQLDEGSVTDLYALGRVFLTTGQFAEARQVFEKLVGVNPDFYPGLQGLPATHAGIGESATAMEITRRLVACFPGYLARAPDDARAHILFASYLAEVGEREQAMLEADTALALGGHDGIMLYNLCCTYSLLGESGKAVETFAQAVEAGYGNLRWARLAPDLEPIRSDPKFVLLTEGP